MQSFMLSSKSAQFLEYMVPVLQRLYPHFRGPAFQKNERQCCQT